MAKRHNRHGWVLIRGRRYLVQCWLLARGEADYGVWYCVTSQRMCELLKIVVNAGDRGDVRPPCAIATYWIEKNLVSITFLPVF